MLRGKRVQLRTVERRDLPTLRQWRCHPDVYRFFESKDQLSELQQERWFEKVCLDPNAHYFVIEDADGTFLGSCNVKGLHPVHRTANWGVYFVPEHTNSLAAVEVAIVLLDWTFDYLNVRKLCVEVLASNTRALRYNETLGFSTEGRLVRQVYHEGQYVDTVVMGLFPEDYRAAVAKYRKVLFGADWDFHAAAPRPAGEEAPE